MFTAVKVDVIKAFNFCLKAFTVRLDGGYFVTLLYGFDTHSPMSVVKDVKVSRPVSVSRYLETNF